MTLRRTNYKLGEDLEGYQTDRAREAEEFQRAIDEREDTCVGVGWRAHSSVRALSQQRGVVSSRLVHAILAGDTPIFCVISICVHVLGMLVFCVSLQDRLVISCCIFPDGAAHLG